MRWQQLLFGQGFGTRRECDALVLAGRVQHDGAPIAHPDDTVTPFEGMVYRVEGRDWPWHASALVLLHKPAGYECSQKPSAAPSVMTLLPPPLRRRGVQAVGRLDLDTTGLLLLTDDGPLLHRLTSPKHHVPKVYVATAKHVVSDTQVAQLLAGVELVDEPGKPVRAAACERIDERRIRLTLTEGKYHQVKRMLAAVGNRCEGLHREAIGGLRLPGELAVGQWRWLGSAERALIQSSGSR